MTASPDVSVVMASFNRGEKVRRSVASVLDQSRRARVELVVVDSSDDDTREVLESIVDPRLVVLARPNLGMPVARNMGLDVVTGEWVAFLDDDDVLHPDWADRLLGAADDETDIVVAGHTRRAPDGRVLAEEAPGPIGVDARTFIAGTFIVRTALLRGLGGMLEGLPSGHHWELAVRLARTVDTPGSVVTVADAVVDIEVREVTARDLATPLQLYDGMRWILVRHRAALADRRDRRATFSANVAVPAARLGLWSAARRWMLVALSAGPGEPRNWGRFLLTCLPPLGRRVWGDARAYAPENNPSRRGLRGLADLAAERGTSPDLLMLPDGYTERQEVEGSGATDDSERAARRLATRVAESRRRQMPADAVHRVIDVDDDALPEPVGDADAVPLLVVCPATLSKVADPYAVLRTIRERLSSGGEVVITEPDRDVVDGPGSLGPPSGGWARRRWTAEELALVVEAAGLRIVLQRPRVPRLPWSRHRDPVILIVAR